MTVLACDTGDSRALAEGANQTKGGRQELSRPSTSTAVDEVARALKDEILLGILPAGRRMTEDELMRRFEVKRHIVRSGLHVLVDQGLAEHLPNAGVSVKSFTDKEVHDLYEARVLLESNTARLIPLPVAKSELAEVVQALEDHRRAVGKSRQLEIIEANDRFHSAVFALAGNTVLSEAIRVHAQKTAPIRFLNVSSREKMERSIGEHAAIVEALEAGDSGRLVQLCADHLHPTRDAYLGARS